jgi:formamidopyrimidine-DNA glycosylase
MPELPELEVVKEVLRTRVQGRRIERVELVPPGAGIVVRDLTGRGFTGGLNGALVLDVRRRGKFILFDLTTSAGAALFLVINPKLTGRLQLAQRRQKRRGKTHLVFDLGEAGEMRYIDAKVMGQVYLTGKLDSVPDFATLGPEPFDISLEEFHARLKPYRGEIKGILIRGEFLAGIGNAYADEILWAARLHPYRKRTQLTPVEIDRLYYAIQATLRASIDRVRAEMGEDIYREPRDFFAVHMKTGEPCPRCATTISAVTANQRITNFCRTCQPGGLIRGM